MKALLIVYATVMASTAFAAESFSYPVLNDYNMRAETLIQGTQAAQTADQLAQIKSGTEDLMKVGVEIMDLYGRKNPNCQAQFAAFEQALPQMTSLSVDQVLLLYHDGKGLPEAPKHCYFGRSEIVHPVLNHIRLQGPFSEDVRAQIIEDFQEVQEHLARIQRNLDNPPN